MKKATAFGETAKKKNSTAPKTPAEERTSDAAFKRLCTKKEFLTPILKHVVKEYSDYSPKEIEQFIVDFSIESTVRGVEDIGQKDETVITYDVLINCMLPGGSGEIKVDFVFDLEMQRENDTGYPIAKRGVYYCSRLLSSQIKRLGKESYNQLKPVYSVWIIRKGFAKELQNSIYTASLHGSFNSGIPANKLNRDVDLIHLVLVFLSEGMDYSGGDQLQQYLQAVFSKRTTDRTVNPYADYSVAIEEEVDNFMTLDQAAEERGIQIGEERGIQIGEERGIQIGEERGIQIGEERGIQIGEERGIKQGIQKERKEMIRTFLKKNASPDFIVEYTDLPIEEVNRIIKEIEEGN